MNVNEIGSVEPSVWRLFLKDELVTVERLRGHGLGQWAWRQAENEALGAGAQLGVHVSHLLSCFVERLPTTRATMLETTQTGVQQSTYQ